MTQTLVPSKVTLGANFLLFGGLLFFRRFDVN